MTLVAQGLKKCMIKRADNWSTKDRVGSNRARQMRAQNYMEAYVLLLT